MKKNTRLKKQIIFFLSVFVLFSIAGITSAQLKPTAVDTKNATDISTYKSSTTTQKEIDNIEKSVSKTEAVFNTLDSAIGDTNNTENIDSQGSTERRNGVSSNDTRGTDGTISEMSDNLNSRVRFQVEVLKELRKNSISKIMQDSGVFTEDVNKKGNIKDAKLEDSIKEVNSETADKKNISEQKRNTEPNSDIPSGVTNTSIDSQLNEIDTTISKTSEDLKKLENLTLKKKEKIIARSVTKKAIAESLKDSDGDGISNYDEINIYGTNPFVADTNGNGYGDGAEILAGFNPKSKTGNAIIAYQNPKNSGTIDKKLFSVSSIKVKKVKEKINIIDNKKVNEVATSSSRVSFKGKSLPNSFVTLYIFSIPTVVTVKTDTDGNWNYTMDKELENGNHEIYVAMTDNTGKIITKSNPIPFVKEALAVTVDKQLLSNNTDISKPSFFNFGYVYVVVLILVFLIGIALTIIGIKLRFSNVKTEDNS